MVPLNQELSLGDIEEEEGALVQMQGWLPHMVIDFLELAAVANLRGHALLDVEESNVDFQQSVEVFSAFAQDLDAVFSVVDGKIAVIVDDVVLASPQEGAVRLEFIRNYVSGFEVVLPVQLQLLVVHDRGSHHYVLVYVALP
jgi:hypothetical protein